MSATWVCLAILARAAFADDPKPYPVPVQPDPGDPKPYPVPVTPPDQQPPDQKPPDQKPPDQKPPEAKPPDAKPPDAKPPDAKPPDAKPPVKPATPPSQQPPSQQPPVRIDSSGTPLPDAPPRREEPRHDEPPEQISNEPLTGSEKIGEIIVRKNTKTIAETVELIARIDVGDDFTADMIERIRHDLVSSGLFSDVEVYWDRLVGKKDVRVHLLVEDKHSWVIAPAFYNQPTNTGVGVGYGENNLFGQNQKLLIYGQIATGDSFFVGAWQIPSLYGTRFHAQLDTYLASIRNFEYAPPIHYLSSPKQVRESRLEYLNAGIKLGVDLFRGVRIDTRIRAATVSYSDVKLADGATLMDLGLTDPSAPIPKPGKEGTDVSHEIDFTIDRRANWYGVQTGYKMAVSYEYAASGLGSDFHYSEWGLSLYRAYQVLERHNLVLKGNLQVGHRMPFQQEFEMGGTSMRGWLNNQFRGDFKALANVEYSLPLFTLFGLGVRGLAFWDSGYTAFLTTSNPERNYLPSSAYDCSGCSVFAPFKNSVGVGTRLYLRQIVIPLLGIDVGYGLEARDYQVYLAIGLTD
jgi:outer membrane protein assembly factor BamA